MAYLKSIEARDIQKTAKNPLPLLTGEGKK